MKSEYSSTLDWDNGEKESHTMNLNLQIELRDFLDAQDNVAQRLLENEQGIRRDIFELVRTRVVPGLLQDTPMDSSIPHGGVHTNSTAKTQSDNSIGRPRSGRGSIRYRGDIHVDLKAVADRRLNAMQMLNANKEMIAHQVANTIINSLRHEFLGETKHHTAYSSETKNGDLLRYEAQNN